MPHIWSIVLAAGQGRRLASLTGGIPKQFWSPRGDETLLEQTLDRLTPVVPLTRTLTVIDRSQRALAEALSSRSSLGHLLDQPSDRGTAAGVLLGLSDVMSREADALVVLSPSDHGIARAAEFRGGLRQAAAAIDTGRAEIVLFGVQPQSALGDYGWVTSSSAAATAGTLRPVASFVEKPPLPVAEELLAEGAVWNTMVMVARGQALLDLYARHLPWLAAPFDHARQIDARRRGAFLSQTYSSLPRTDFSRDLLTPARGLSLFTWPASLGWTDLGTPSRLGAWLDSAPVGVPSLPRAKQSAPLTCVA